MGKDLEELRMDLFEHMELHERIHRGDEKLMNNNVSSMNSYNQYCSYEIHYLPFVTRKLPSFG